MEPEKRDHKPAIGDGTKQRHDRGDEARKALASERERKLISRRKPNEITRQKYSSLSSESPAVALANYNGAELMQGSDVQLKRLAQVMTFVTGSDDQNLQSDFGQLIPRLFGDQLQVITVLVSLCSAEKSAAFPESANCALVILLHLTGLGTLRDTAVMISILRSGMIQHMIENLRLLWAGEPCWLTQNDTAHTYLWDLVANMILSSREAHSEVTGTPLFFGQLPVFLQDAQWISRYEHDRENVIIFPAVVCALRNALLDGPMEKMSDELLVECWHLLMHAFFWLIPETPQMDPSHMYTFEAIISSMARILDLLDDARAIALVAEGIGGNSLLQRIFYFLRTLEQGIHVRALVHLLQIMAELPVKERTFHFLMRQNDSITYMSRLLDSKNTLLRTYVLAWIGNYAAAGSDFACDLFADVLPAVARCIESDPNQGCRELAVKVVKCVVETCLYDIYEVATRAAAARQMLYRIIVTERLFHQLVPMCGLLGQERLTLLILQTVQFALKWDVRQACQEIEACGLLDKIEVMMGTAQNPAIFACVTDILSYTDSFTTSESEPLAMDQMDSNTFFSF